MLPICDQIKTALLSKGCRYYDVLIMIKAYEKADWATFFRYAEDFGLNENEMPELYVQALEGTNKFLVVR